MSEHRGDGAVASFSYETLGPSVISSCLTGSSAWRMFKKQCIIFIVHGVLSKCLLFSESRYIPYVNMLAFAFNSG